MKAISETALTLSIKPCYIGHNLIGLTVEWSLSVGLTCNLFLPRGHGSNAITSKAKVFPTDVFEADFEGRVTD